MTEKTHCPKCQQPYSPAMNEYARRAHEKWCGFFEAPNLITAVDAAIEAAISGRAS